MTIFYFFWESLVDLLNFTIGLMRCTLLGCLIDRYRKKGILVDKLFGLPQHELEQRATSPISTIMPTLQLNATCSGPEESYPMAQERIIESQQIPEKSVDNHPIISVIKKIPH